MDIKKIKFDSNGLVPAIAQDSTTGEVLMLAYMNAESLKKTLETMRAHYYSRSRQELWEKGATSGNTQEVLSISYDCDGDTLLMKVKQTGVACHTGEPSCFFNPIAGNDTSDNTGVDDTDVDDTGAEIITELYRTILLRKGSSPEKSYVASLFAKGPKMIAAKIHEESAELISSAKGSDKEHIVHELCDLWFHTLVLLAKDDIPLSDVFKELKRRSGTSGLEEKASREKKS